MSARAISVVICTHNPRADYFGRTLAALAAQSLPRQEWELLVVDNCSASPVADRFDLSWHPNVRVVREEKLGLTPARLRGIREAASDLLVFVDDDNVLDQNYLALALEISAEYARLGAWGGSCKGEYESEPPEWSRKHLQILCVYEYERDYWCNYPFQNRSMPSGAGMCIRADAARKYLELHDRGLRPLALDRTGKSLLSGGDIDMDLTCADIGYGMGVFPRLQLTHLIPGVRVQKTYLLNLTEAIAASGVVVEHYHPSPAVPSGSKFKTMLANTLRKLFLSPVDRQFYNARQRGLRTGQKLVAELVKNGDRGVASNKTNGG
jgi:glycosyltransferase involved in cell wall biosynthesis